MSLLTDLISYWALDEASGNATDSHGSNTLTENTSISSVAGKVGNARDLEGSGLNNYFTRTSNSSLQSGNIDFTFSCWIKAESQASNNTIISKWANSGNQREYALFFDATPRLNFRISADGTNGTFANATATTATTNGTWQFVVFWHDSVNNQLAIQIDNGTPVTTSHSAGVYVGTADFYLGSAQGGLTVYDGVLDEVGFWKRVLTTQERTDLYNGGAGLAYSSFGGGASIVGPLIGGGHLLGNGPLVGGRLVA